MKENVQNANNSPYPERSRRAGDGGKPIIAITMGDPASIGPEIAIKALLETKIHNICKPLLVGDAKYLSKSFLY
ncbi:MAG: hypothetical protein WDM90_06470 [Ferruginibacter sp.]